MKKIIALLLTTCFVLAAAAASFAAAGFTDVEDQYWGVPYIQKAADAGIINGYPQEDGSFTFAPENRVSKAESLTMLYRTLAKNGALRTKNDLSESYAEALEAAGIPGWAGIYVSYAFDRGIASDTEFPEGEGGGVPANRELIARWASKAMSYELSPVSVLPYKDFSSIGAEDVFFIDALYRHGIMQGDDKGLFNPADGVKRVEMAAVCTRMISSGRLSYTTELTLERGPLSGFSAEKRSFKLGDLTVTLREDAVLLIDGRAAELSDIAALSGKNVTVSALAGAEKVVMLQTAPVLLEGTIEEFVSTGDYVVLGVSLDSGIKAGFCLTSDTKKFKSLREGAKVRLIADGALLLETN